ncbi:MAG TPA: hypothetical protein VH189_07780, partial [Rhizomicrobium sp.]|nr:hypothetical protein [Rhizomicrobium sp.]
VGSGHFPVGTIWRALQSWYFCSPDGFRNCGFGDSVSGVVFTAWRFRFVSGGWIMNKRAPVPKLFSTRATTIVLIIILLPFAIVALSWAFDYVSRAM